MALGGVRVGRAYVAVDAEYRPTSLKQVGRQIERQLTAISKRNGQIYRELGYDVVAAWRGMLGAMVTSAPLMGSLVSGLTGGVTMLAGALWSTVTSASAALPVLTSVGIAAGTARVAFQGFGTALRAANPEELTAALANLSPSAGASAIAVRSLSDEANALRLAVQENFFAGLADDIERLGTTIMPVATAGMSRMATVLNGLAKSILDYVNSSAGLSVINDVFTNSASIVKTLSGAVVPFLDGFLRLVNALSPAAERLAGRITDIALRFQGWTQAEGFATRIDKGMQKAEKTAGLLFDVIGNLGSAIGNIFDAANPSTNTFLEILGRVTGRFKEFTESVGGQEAIAKWASESVTVLSQFGETIRAVFEVLQDLSDPRIITSFLATVQHAFEILGNLPLERLVSTFADLAEALQPISGPMLAIIVAGVSMQMMIGSLMGQMAGAVGIFAGFRTVIGSVGPSIDKVKGGFASLGSSAGKHASSFGKFSAVLGRIGGILAKGLKFAGLIGLGVTIVSVIAKSENLQNKLKAVWESVKGVFESLGSAFSGVSSAAGPLLSTLEPVFAIFEKIVGIGVALVLDTIKFAFDSLGKAIEGAGTFISGFLTVLNGLFTLDFGMILDGLRTAISGIPALLQGLLGLFITFFAPAKLLAIGSRFFGGLLSGLRSAFPGIMTAIGGFLSRILTFFVELGPRLVSSGASMMRGLGEGISAGFTFIRTLISDFITGLATRVTTGFTVIRDAVGTAMTAIKTVFTTVWDGILIAVRFVWDGIVAAFNSGVALIKAVWDAGIAALRVVVDTVFVPIGNAIRGLLTAIVDVFRATGELIRSYWKIAWDAISTTVSTVLAYIGGAVRAGMEVVSSVVSKVLSTIRKVFSSAWDTISTTVSTALAYVGGAIRSGMKTAQSIVTTVLSAIRSFFSSVWDTISTTVSTALAYVAGAVRSRMEAIRSAISTAMDAVKSAVSRAFDAAKDAVSRAMSAMWDAVSNGVSRVVGVIRSLPGKILSALGNFGSLLRDKGAALIGGLVDGITGSIGRVTGAMGNIASRIRSFLPGSPVKEGPLRSWNNGGAGKRLAGLLTKGLDDSQRDVERSAGRLAGILAGATPSSLSLPPLTGSPSRAGTSSVTSPGSASSAPNPGGVTINVTIDPKDLAGLRTVEDFLAMLNVRTAMARGV